MYGPNARSDENCFVIVPLYAVESQPRSSRQLFYCRVQTPQWGTCPLTPPPGAQPPPDLSTFCTLLGNSGHPNYRRHRSTEMTSARWRTVDLDPPQFEQFSEFQSRLFVIIVYYARRQQNHINKTPKKTQNYTTIHTSKNEEKTPQKHI